MDKICLDIGIPEYLHQGDKTDDQAFESHENLFRRFITKAPYSRWINDKQISASIFKLKDDSYNREKYSKSSHDVLFNIKAKNQDEHYQSWGIVSIKVKELVGYKFEIEQNNFTRQFTLKPVHKPVKCMYPHSEVKIYENGKEIIDNKPKSTKVAIRDYLVGKLKIVKTPSDN